MIKWELTPSDAKLVCGFIMINQFRKRASFTQQKWEHLTLLRKQLHGLITEDLRNRHREN